MKRYASIFNNNKIYSYDELKDLWYANDLLVTNKKRLKTLKSFMDEVKSGEIEEENFLY